MGTTPQNVGPGGEFGANCSPAGDYSFPGNLGIGVPNPSAKLHVIGRAILSGDFGMVNTAATDPGFGATGVLLKALAGTPYVVAKLGTTNDVNSAFVVFDASNKEVFRVAANGALNQIVFLSAAGHNDGTRTIQGAINALPANGGIIMLMPGIYNIQTPINVNKNGVKLRGYGGLPADGIIATPSDPLTKLKWTNASAGTVVSLASTVSNAFIADLELSNLTIDCNSVATIGLLLDRVVHSRFVSVHVRKVAGGAAGIKLTTTATQDNINTAWNDFLDCSVFDTSVGVWLTKETSANANCSHNSFIGLSVQYRGTDDADAALKLSACDNNAFFRTWLIRQGGIKGAGVLVDDRTTAAANFFYHLQASAGGFVVQTQAPPQAPPHDKNVIFGYSVANGEPPPRSTPDTDIRKFVYWTDSLGNTDLRYNNLTSALSAANFPATQPNEFGFVWDGANFWFIFYDGVHKWKWQGTEVF